MIRNCFTLRIFVENLDRIQKEQKSGPSDLAPNDNLSPSRRIAGHHYLFMNAEAAKFEYECSLNGQE